MKRSRSSGEKRNATLYPCDPPRRKLHAESRVCTESISTHLDIWGVNCKVEIESS